MAQGDRSLASQILLNLVLNAASALNDIEERRVSLSLRSGIARGRADDVGDEWNGRRRADIISCWVEDSGEGVQLDEPSRIFDPFFTTKAPGKGTGLGLANALRLAEEMGGGVELREEPSELGGARFVFSLTSAVSADVPEKGQGSPQDVRLNPE